jgi:hypothetical protein
MKQVLQVTIMVLLSLVVSCTKHTQPAQSAPREKEAKSPSATSPAATDRGTPADAQAMLRKAVEHYNDVGRKQALADFTGRKAPFFDRDLYVFCIGPNHIIVANGGFPQFVGNTVDTLRDAEGKAIGKAFWDVASNTGEGSVKYRWINPVSGRTEPKIGFVQKVGEDVCGVGAYNP